MNCLKDLKHVESQIKSMSVMPDFGYAEDNYLIDSVNNNKWKTISSLLGDNERFSWLMNFIQLSKIETRIEKEEEKEEAQRRLRAQMRAERRVQFQEEAKLSSIKKLKPGELELRQLIDAFHESQDTIDRFKRLKRWPATTKTSPVRAGHKESASVVSPTSSQRTGIAETTPLEFKRF